MAGVAWPRGEWGADGSCREALCHCAAGRCEWPLDHRPDAFLKVPLTQIPEVFVFCWPGVRGFGVLRS